MLLLLACAAEPEPVEPRGDCNPVDDGHCALPFPSSFHLVEADTGSGYRVDFGPTTLPGNIDGVPLQPARWNQLDGFPILGMMLAHLPEADLSLAISHEDLGAYLDDDATTVVLDVETGERVPHFVEREVQATEGQQLLVLRPVAPMEHGHRHVVGIRGLGGDAPPGFAALRDGTEGEPDLERQRAHYEDLVFPALEAEGFAREDLLLAWDFVTVSEDNLATMEQVRDEGLEHEPAYTLGSVTEGCPTVYDGTFTAPLYLDSWGPGSLLNLGEDGLPYADGLADVPFRVRVPCGLEEPARLVQFGHGVLGELGEMSHLDGLAEEHGWVTFAVSWTGMKDDDIGDITLSVAQDLTNFSIVPDRLHQGHLDAMPAQRRMTTSFPEEPAVEVATSSVTFHGVSQGGILGGAQVAMSPTVDRGVLVVPGMPFTLILARSDNFHPFLKLFEIKYDDWRDITVLIAAMQMLWDPVESAGWAHHQDKDVLVQAAIGDAAVTTLSAHVMARAYGLPLVEPSARPIWGLDGLEAPYEGGGLVELDYGVEEPVEAVPCDTETNTHHGPGSSSAARQQAAIFHETGLVEQTCDGACDPD